MIALVTGSSGFIGGSLVAELLRHGDEVRCLVRPTSRISREAPANLMRYTVDYTRPDLGLAPDVLRGVDIVYHLAGATNAISVAAFYRANVEPIGNLLHALHAAGATPKRLLLVSSQAAGGPALSPAQPVTEQMRGEPFEPYGGSKRAAELVLDAAAGDIPFTVVRPAAVYGPGDRAFLTIFKMARRGVVLYPAIRDHWVSVIAIDDVIEGILKAASNPGAVGGTYYLAHEQPVQWREIYRVVAATLGRARVVEINVPSLLVDTVALAGDALAAVTGRARLLNRNKVALGTPRFWICSTQQAARELDFQATTGLQDGMRAAYDWYLQQRWL
ncbi:MAG TPA: NAD-dependent epimerase/dehydratase family protein [Gemmatimonadaceae bacterium]|nr:NAD-dependent epimerase/dehydratase family protein [Gemmatimonadaceae bacterium]